MEQSQKTDLPLNAGIDTRSSDMLVPVTDPKLAHNRQRWQGHTLPTSLRYEHDGWAAGWDVHEFDFEDGYVESTDGKTKIGRSKLNGNPAYLVQVYDAADDNNSDIASFKYNGDTSVSAPDIGDITAEHSDDADVIDITGTFNGKTFDIQYDATAKTASADSDMTVTASVNSRGVTSLRLTDTGDSMTGSGSHVQTPTGMFNREGGYKIADPVTDDSDTVTYGNGFTLSRNGQLTGDSVTQGYATSVNGDGKTEGVYTEKVSVEQAITVQTETVYTAVSDLQAVTTYDAFSNKALVSSTSDSTSSEETGNGTVVSSGSSVTVTESVVEETSVNNTSEYIWNTQKILSAKVIESASEGTDIDALPGVSNKKRSVLLDAEVPVWEGVYLRIPAGSSGSVSGSKVTSDYLLGTVSIPGKFYNRSYSYDSACNVSDWVLQTETLEDCTVTTDVWISKDAYGDSKFYIYSDGASDSSDSSDSHVFKAFRQGRDVTDEYTCIMDLSGVASFSFTPASYGHVIYDSGSSDYNSTRYVQGVYTEPESLRFVVENVQIATSYNLYKSFDWSNIYFEYEEAVVGTDAANVSYSIGDTVTASEATDRAATGSSGGSSFVIKGPARGSFINRNINTSGDETIILSGGTYTNTINGVTSGDSYMTDLSSMGVESPLYAAKYSLYGEYAAGHVFPDGETLSATSAWFILRVAVCRRAHVLGRLIIGDSSSNSCVTSLDASTCTIKPLSDTEVRNIFGNNTYKMLFADREASYPSNVTSSKKICGDALFSLECSSVQSLSTEGSAVNFSVSLVAQETGTKVFWIDADSADDIELCIPGDIYNGNSGSVSDNSGSIGCTDVALSYTSGTITGSEVYQGVFTVTGILTAVKALTGATSAFTAGTHKVDHKFFDTVLPAVSDFVTVSADDPDTIKEYLDGIHQTLRILPSDDGALYAQTGDAEGSGSYWYKVGTGGVLLDYRYTASGSDIEAAQVYTVQDAGTGVGTKYSLAGITDYLRLTYDGYSLTCTGALWDADSNTLTLTWETDVEYKYIAYLTEAWGWSGLTFTGWEGGVLSFSGQSASGGVFTATLNQYSMLLTVSYKTYTYQQTLSWLTTDLDALKELGVSKSEYSGKLINSFSFSQSVYTDILLKAFGIFSTTDCTNLGYDNASYLSVNVDGYGDQKYLLSGFDDAESWLNFKVTDVRDPDMSTRSIHKTLCSDEYQFVKQAWDTTVETEKFWWLTDSMMLTLGKYELTVRERSDGIDDWAGDKWGADADGATVKTFSRADYLPSTVIKYGCTCAYKGAYARFWTLEGVSDTKFKISVYSFTNDSGDLLDTPLKVTWTFRVDHAALGSQLYTANSDSTAVNTSRLCTYSQLNATAMLSQMEVSATAVKTSSRGTRLIFGFHLDNNLNQWAWTFRDTSGKGTGITSAHVLIGYGYVGVNGCLTGGELPSDYFGLDSGADSGYGFTGTVRDISALDTEEDDVSDPSELSIVNDMIVGNENQQWYIKKSLSGIVSHITYDPDSDAFEAVELPITNTYAHCYDSPSFFTRMAGDALLNAKSFSSLIPNTSGSYQTVWKTLLAACGWPMIYYVNPKITTINYLQQTLGQYAYVHNNSTSLYQKADTAVSKTDSPMDSSENDSNGISVVSRDELSFDVQHVKQKQDSGKYPWSEFLFMLGATGISALENSVDMMKVNTHQNQTADSDKGKKYSQMYLKNIESMTSTEFVTQSTTPTLISEVTAVKTLDMFYSTSAGQHVCAGPGWVNHNFVAQCIAQSATSVQLETQQLSIMYIIKGLTNLQMNLELELLKKLNEYIGNNARDEGGTPFMMAGLASGTSYGWVISLVLNATRYAAAIAYNTLEMSLPVVDQTVSALGGDRLQSSVTAKQSKHVYDIEGKHRYGSKSESFMWPCFDCENNLYTDEKVKAETVSKPWEISMSPFSSYISSSQLAKQIFSLMDSAESKPDNTTIEADSDLRQSCEGDVDYRIASCYGETEDKILPDGMAVVTGAESFLPTVPFKNENIGETEPVFGTPVIHDYIIDSDWNLAMTATDGGIAWVSCKDTKIIDGQPSNIVIQDGFCGVASDYAAVEVKRGISKRYLRPWAVTPDAIGLNCSGYNCVFEGKAYHAFDGYGYRIINWYGASGMNKERYALQYAFQVNDRFKRSNKLPPNQFLGNFMSPPMLSMHTEDPVFSKVTVPSENMGMDAGVLGEDPDIRRFSLPVFSEFVSTLPAIVKTYTSYRLAVIDGVTSLTTDVRTLTSGYKLPVSVDFNIADRQFRLTNDYICSVENTSAVSVVTPMVATLGLTYLGASLTAAYFYSQATRMYYMYTGGSDLRAVDMLERFRDITEGRWDFVNHEVIMPCLATFDRLDALVSDDEDETDNIFVASIHNGMIDGEVTPPNTEIFNTDSWYRTLSLPSGLTYQGPNRCIINRYVFMDYMKEGILSNKGKWTRVPREVYHPFRKYPGKFETVETDVDSDIKGWTHNPFLLVTAPLGVNEETDCKFEWEVTFAWTYEMDLLYAQDEYVVVNLKAETMTPGGKVYSRPTHIYLRKDLFTRNGNYGYYSFRYSANNGIGNRERLHIWSDGYIAVSSVQLDYKPMTTARTSILTQQMDTVGMKEM